jgi:hypothetical protein
MTEQNLPPWGADPLSVFFSDAEHNDRVSSLNLPLVYTLLQRVHTTLQRCDETIEKDNRDELLVTRFLIVRTHSAFLASIRLAMSGQVFEAYPVLRAAIEQAWYALHIAKDPHPPKRAKLWLCRNDDVASKAACKSEFMVAKVRSTHESLDVATARQLQELYEDMIDFGGHPNQLGVLTSVSKLQEEKQITYRIGILHPGTVAQIFVLRMAAAVAVGALKIFQLVFPERFRIMGIDSEIHALVNEVNTVFKPYVPKVREAGTTG